jgi:hypothetical protein
VQIPKEARNAPVHEAIEFQLATRGVRKPQVGWVLHELYVGGIAEAHPEHRTYRVASFTGIPIPLDKAHLPPGTAFLAQADGSAFAFVNGRLMGRVWPAGGQGRGELVLLGRGLVSPALSPSKSGEDDRKYIQARLDAFTALKNDLDKPAPSKLDLLGRDNICVTGRPPQRPVTLPDLSGLLPPTAGLLTTPPAPPG